MASHLNKRQLHGIAGTVTFKNPDGTAIAGYVCPNIQGLEFSHKGKVEKIPDQSGNTGAIIAFDDYIEVTFDFIPQGTSEANARTSALIPQLLATATITGFPIIKLGPFTDGLNTDGGSTQPWIYEGDGSGSGNAESHWTGKVTLRRYVSITNTAAVIA